MGRHQTEAAYLKSVLLWLQGYWTESVVTELVINAFKHAFVGDEVAGVLVVA